MGWGSIACVYESKASLLQAIASSAGIWAAQQLQQDAKPYVQKTLAIITEETIFASDPNSTGPRLVNLYSFRGVLSRHRMDVLNYWKTVHSKLALRLQAALNYRAYEQLHVQDGEEFQTLLQVFGESSETGFDGIASLGYGNEGELMQAFLSARTQCANLKLMQDEVTFINAARSSLMLGYEYDQGELSTMNTIQSQRYEWHDYYQAFPYFSPELIRDGCHPRIMEHDHPPQKAIVLVHGLTDSPALLTDIAEYFFSTLGYNVYLPLLHFHGLKDPQGMEGIALREWKANVEFAIHQAAIQAEQISIGGLSTGGTLGLYEAITHPKINDALYLFSAALDLVIEGKDKLGDIVELLLLTPLIDCFDTNQDLVGSKPFAYTRMDVDGAQQLAKLILEIEVRLKLHNANNRLPVKVFAAHSEVDDVADIKAIQALEAIAPLQGYQLFILPKAEQVSHADVVLQNPIYAIGANPPNPPLRKANPRFMEMMTAIAEFQVGGDEGH